MCKKHTHSLKCLCIPSKYSGFSMYENIFPKLYSVPALLLTALNKRPSLNNFGKACFLKVTYRFALNKMAAKNKPLCKVVVKWGSFAHIDF